MLGRDGTAAGFEFRQSSRVWITYTIGSGMAGLHLGALELSCVIVVMGVNPMFGPMASKYHIEVSWFAL